LAWFISVSSGFFLAYVFLWVLFRVFVIGANSPSVSVSFWSATLDKPGVSRATFVSVPLSVCCYYTTLSTYQPSSHRHCTIHISLAEAPRFCFGWGVFFFFLFFFSFYITYIFIYIMFFIYSFLLPIQSCGTHSQGPIGKGCSISWLERVSPRTPMKGRSKYFLCHFQKLSTTIYPPIYTYIPNCN